MKWITGIMMLTLLLSTACVESESTETTQTATPAATEKKPPRRVPGQNYLDQAQPKLRTIKLWLGPHELETEIASTTTQIATGMMYRTEMAENEAMLFVFPVPFKASFYMRNTVLPLSCAYIGSNGEILELHDMTPHSETPIEASTDKVQYVLEVNQGWFKRQNIGVGAIIAAEKGSLSKVFFGRE